MIRVVRGAEPVELAPIRRAEVARLAGLVKQGGLPRARDFGHQYNVTRRPLWKAQRRKCCYCERRIDRLYNDVEHFRPKTRAYRGGGRRVTRGYWWLAWTWTNLLFACPTCNRRYKKNEFPLAHKSPILRARCKAPGAEVALLIDPADGQDDPMDHIQFVPFMKGRKRMWIPVARAGSKKGHTTIDVLKLARPELLTAYADHVSDVIEDRASAVREAIASGNAAGIMRAWEKLREKLFYPRQQFKALSYDVLDHHFPHSVRQRWGLSLPRPGQTLSR